MAEPTNRLLGNGEDYTTADKLASWNTLLNDGPYINTADVNRYTPQPSWFARNAAPAIDMWRNAERYWGEGNAEKQRQLAGFLGVPEESVGLGLGLMGGVKAPGRSLMQRLREFPQGRFDPAVGSPPLPMDQASKDARAAEQGYGQTWYHGTPNPRFSHFDPMEPGTFFSSDPDYAASYADAMGDKNADPYRVRGPIKEVELHHDPDIEKHIGAIDDHLAKAKDEGYSGVRFVTPGDRQEIEMIVPMGLENRIRRPDAAFDPAKLNSKNLMRFSDVNMDRYPRIDALGTYTPGQRESRHFQDRREGVREPSLLQNLLNNWHDAIDGDRSPPMQPSYDYDPNGPLPGPR